MALSLRGASATKQSHEQQIEIEFPTLVQISHL